MNQLSVITRHEQVYQTLQALHPLLYDSPPLTYQSPWVIPDTDGKDAYNPFTDNTYQGFNQLRLSYARYLVEYPLNAWATFHQIKQQGGNVKKGSKSQSIRFYTPQYKDKDGRIYSAEKVAAMSDAKRQALKISCFQCLKHYRVFNLSQTQGLADEYYYLVKPMLHPVEEDPDIEYFVQALQLNIQHQESAIACYHPNTDMITLPLKNQFHSSIGYYEVLFHEIGHALGSPKRLNRYVPSKFGEEAYAKEELNAELFSATMLHYFGYQEHFKNAAAYLRAWLSVLHADNRSMMPAYEAVGDMMCYLGIT